MKIQKQCPYLANLMDPMRMLIEGDAETLNRALHEKILLEIARACSTLMPHPFFQEPKTETHESHKGAYLKDSKSGLQSLTIIQK